MEPVLHYLIPVIFLLIVFPKVNKKMGFSLAALALIIDLEFYTPLHRALTHNLLFMFIVSVIFYFLVNKEAMYLSLYFIGSHLILDSAFPGNALFYPFYDKAFYITINITSGFIFDFDIGTTDLALRPKVISYLFTTEAFLILTLLIILLAVKYRKTIFTYKKN